MSVLLFLTMEKSNHSEKSQPTKFSFLKRIVSCGHAFNGLKILIKEEHNAWIHLVAAFCVVIAGVVFHISTIEWVVVIFCIGLVFALELMNSAIENTADLISKEQNEIIKNIKDLSAGAVLVAAIGSVVIGMIIFLPKILQ